MKIAVTSENGLVFQHFGKCPSFVIADMENGRIKEKTLLSANGQGHGALVTLLQEAGVEVLICSGLGAGARNALQEAAITVISGAQGSVEAALTAYENGTLHDDPSGQCDHHHEDGHDCSHSAHCH